MGIDLRESSLVVLDAPREEDKKPVMVMSPSTEGMYTWLSSYGDDITPDPGTSGRGDGDQLKLAFTGASTEYVDIRFIEPVELHDGHVDYSADDWGFEDHWSFGVVLPASTVEVNGSGTGNCNLYKYQDLTPWDSETSYAVNDLVTHENINYVCISAHTNQEPPNATYWAHYLNVILPAAGDGAFDIDLDGDELDAVPVPCSTKEYGYWTVPDKWDEDMEALAEATSGEWNLLDFPINMWFCRKMACGSQLGLWDLDAYKAEWISKKWTIRFESTRTTDSAGIIGGYLMIFRPGAV